MRLVVVTGGSGTGQEQVVKMLMEKGICVLDQNEITNNLLVSESKIFTLVLEKFGWHIVNPNGKLNRDLFEKEVLSIPNKRKEFESMMTPYVAKEFFKKIIWQWIKYRNTVVLSIPRFFEDYTGPYYIFHEILTVFATKNQQISRLMAAGVEDPKKLVGNEIPIQFKKTYSNTIIDNTGNDEHLSEEVTKVIDRWNTTNTPFYFYPKPLDLIVMIVLLVFLILFVFPSSTK